jgi:hypothetical protein
VAEQRQSTITLSIAEARTLIETAISSFSDGPFSYYDTDEGYNAAVAETVDQLIAKLFPPDAPSSRSTNASDVLGWMDSQGPVTRAPGKPT